jgi:hypothetical protein
MKILLSIEATGGPESAIGGQGSIRIESMHAGRQGKDGTAITGSSPAKTRRWRPDVRRREAATRNVIRLSGRVIRLLLRYPSWPALVKHVWCQTDSPFWLWSNS